MERKCRLCEQTKLIADFYAHPAMAGGRDTKCKECTKRMVRENRANNIEHYRAFDRQRGSLPHRIEARREYQKSSAGKKTHSIAIKKWQRLNAVRRAAHVILGNAVRKGSVVPLPCLICGIKAEAHHPDYDRPLDVVWLCSKHHREAHQAF